MTHVTHSTWKTIPDDAEYSPTVVAAVVGMSYAAMRQARLRHGDDFPTHTDPLGRRFYRPTEVRDFLSTTSRSRLRTRKT